MRDAQIILAIRSVLEGPRPILLESAQTLIEMFDKAGYRGLRRMARWCYGHGRSQPDSFENNLKFALKEGVETMDGHCRSLLFNWNREENREFADSALTEVETPEMFPVAF